MRKIYESKSFLYYFLGSLLLMLMIFHSSGKEKSTGIEFLLDFLIFFLDEIVMYYCFNFEFKCFPFLYFKFGAVVT